MDSELARKHNVVKEQIRGYGSVIVAFSGGVDSSLVAFIANKVLGDKSLAVTSGSVSLKRSDFALTRELADKWGMAHQTITTDELTKSAYRENPINRCFHCKTSLYVALQEIAHRDGFNVVLNGTNCDDLGDHRPGLIAAAEHGVKSPLVDAGFTKQNIRQLAEHLGLENAQKPQAACLSSRFPYGTAIDEQLLAQVEQAENALEAMGFTQFRVRHHGELARLELLPAEFDKAAQLGDEIDTRLKECGYKFVAMDLRGFRSGSLNEGIIDVVQI